MKRLVEKATKLVAGAALALVVGVVAVGLVHSFDQEIKETKLVNSIEQTNAQLEALELALSVSS